MAAYERIEALRRRAGPLGADEEVLLAEALVEDVLWGYDVNLTATHMAASTLGMLSPRTRFRRMNVHRTRLGRFEGQTYIGSLEFLAGRGQPRLAAWPSISGQVDAPETEVEPPPPMDLVIMNPPFTRDSLRHDQFTRAEEQAIKRREQDVLAGQPHRAGVHLSGSSSVFLALGDRMAGDGGTLAAILPAMLATGPAGLGTRQYLASRFRIDTIVASHDPERIFFSENTSIGEILLVCRGGGERCRRAS